MRVYRVKPWRAFGVAGHRAALLIWLTSLWLLNFRSLVCKMESLILFCGTIRRSRCTWGHEIQFLMFSYWFGVHPNSWFSLGPWLLWDSVISWLCLKPAAGVPILWIYSFWHQFPSKLPECFLRLEWNQVGESWLLGHRSALSCSHKLSSSSSFLCCACPPWHILHSRAPADLLRAFRLLSLPALLTHTPTPPASLQHTVSHPAF